jgi:hypothetical protein
MRGNVTRSLSNTNSLGDTVPPELAQVTHITTLGLGGNSLNTSTTQI